MNEVKARKPKALVDAEKKIAELEKNLKYANDVKDSYYKTNQDLTAVVDGIHDVLDDLGIRGYKDENKYTRLPLAVRLFSWSMKLAQGDR